MSKNKFGKRYTPKLKFQAVLEVLEGKETGQVAKMYGVHPTSVTTWKQKILEKGPEIFSAKSTVSEYEKKINKLEQLIGKKEVEIAFLKNFLGQTN